MKYISLLIAITLCFAMTSCTVTEPAETPSPSPDGANQPAASAEAESPEPSPYVIAADDIPLPVSEPSGLSVKEAAATARAQAEAAQIYYDKYNEQTEFIAKNGFFFEYPAREYMTTYMLVESGSLSGDYADWPPYVLYVLPEHMQSIEGISTKVSNDGKPVIYAACQTEDGFVIASANEDCGVMKATDMEALLASYSSNHGEIRRYTADSETYSALDGAIKTFKEDEEALDIRFLAADDKYAFVVCSPVSKPLDIRSYVLKMDNGVWAVVMDGLEKEYQFRKKVTDAFPDMSSNLLPEFDLYFQLKYAKSTFNNLLDELKAQGFITDADGELQFISGTNDFVYAVYESGKKFIGYRDESAEDTGVNWDIRPVVTFLDAEGFMKEKDILPPLFIVKQQ